MPHRLVPPERQSYHISWPRPVHHLWAGKENPGLKARVLTIPF